MNLSKEICVSFTTAQELFYSDIDTATIWFYNLEDMATKTNIFTGNVYCPLARILRGEKFGLFEI